jgi:hypothetical protein
MIEDICDAIYESAKGVAPGQLIWSPVPQLDEVPRILEVDRASSTEHYATKFEIVQVGSSHFRSKQKLPVKLLSLDSTEELLIAKAKLRPCIVVSETNTAFGDKAVLAEVGKRPHLQDHSMIVAPIFGVATAEDPKGFPPIMVARIKALLYSQFFYLPKKCPKTGISVPKEGIVRLDRLFATLLSRGVDVITTRLAEEPRLLLLAMLRERFGGPKDANLQMVRDLLISALPPEARPAPAS